MINSSVLYQLLAAVITNFLKVKNNSCIGKKKQKTKQVDEERAVEFITFEKYNVSLSYHGCIGGFNWPVWHALGLYANESTLKCLCNIFLICNVFLKSLVIYSLWWATSISCEHVNFTPCLVGSDCFLFVCVSKFDYHRGVNCSGSVFLHWRVQRAWI